MRALSVPHVLSGAPHALLLCQPRPRNVSHASSLSIARSQVTCSASALPAFPQARASSSPIASAPAIPSTVGSTTRPVSRSCTTSSGPPASVVVTTGFSDRNASNGTIPKSSSTGA